MGAGEDGWEEGAGLLGEEDEVAEVTGLFKGFQESILGSVIHGIGGSDDEETVASFAAIGEFEKFTDLLDGDKAGGF